MGRSNTDIVARIVIGLVAIGTGVYLLYTEKDKENRRNWVMVVGALLLVAGAVLGFGIVLGSYIVVDEILDWYK